MFLFGGLAALCLIAGFGLGMYEYELRWQIVNAVHSVRRDLEPFALFRRAGSLHRSDVQNLYRTHFPDGTLIRRRWFVSLAAVACFVLGAMFLVLAIRRS
jgi:hypothetical protein